MSQAVAFRTYDRRDSVVFRKTHEQFGGLSNMASGFPLEVKGVPIRTSEALYQACRFPQNPKLQRLIIQQRSPMTAKMKSRPHIQETRPDWDKVRVKIMRWCLRVKLAQNWQTFGALLLSTGDRPIVEDSRKDDFWGAKVVDEETLVGANVLGRLLMELREELRVPNGPQLNRVETLRIPQFWLYGEPIEVVEASSSTQEPETALFGQLVSGSKQRFAIPVSQGIESRHASGPEAKFADRGTENYENTRSNAVIPKECRRLAEVDFPIAVVSKHAAREKSIRHGHPSTLHLWWARRPLAACRAMLLGLLLPDPCDEHCPETFKTRARALLPRVPGEVGATDVDLRRALLRFIGDFANWDLALNPQYLEVSRGLVQATHPEEPPLVVDPFAGGGSIPLEALRLGCEAFASDLNPVACLILKVLLEDLPRHGLELAEELRRVGAEVKEAAEKELAEFYPPDPDGARPIAYIWARTVRCETPNCGAEIPLLRSLWLCKKANRRRALRPKVVRVNGKTLQVEFEVFEPAEERGVSTGTVSRAKATCLCCNTVLSPVRVCSQLHAQRGGADVIFDECGNRIGGARLMAVVILKPDEQGRHYRLPTERDYQAAWKAWNWLKEAVAVKLPNGLNPVPDELLPPIGTLGFRVQRYGMLQWGDLFTARQKLALVMLTHLIRVVDSSSPILRCLLSLNLSHVIERNSSLCRWRPDAYMETVEAVYGRQALPPVWDFAEAIPLSDSTGSWQHSLDILVYTVHTVCATFASVGQGHIADACSAPLPDTTGAAWFTDPPYYDAIPYADLSDFFLVWLKRALPDYSLLRDPFDPENELTPKAREIVQDETKRVEGRAKDRAFFEQSMAQAFTEGRRVLEEDGVGCVVFAHKTTEGWEALLSGMIKGGWVITGSWPIATEMGSRLRARESAALATSIHLVCRPRPMDASVGDWSEVLHELPRRVSDWMERLQAEGVRGADLVFACIGPALEIFSHYAKVETAAGQEVTLAEYLERVWEVVGRTALEQILGGGTAQARNGAARALEEDARLTALFLWTLQSTDGEVNGSEAESDDGDTEALDEDEEEEAPRRQAKGFNLVFDVARRFAQPLGIHLPQWEGRIIETKKGVVRLMAVTERATQLFGEAGSQAVAEQLERSTAGTAQLTLFPDHTEGIGLRGRGRGRRSRSPIDSTDESLTTRREATTLDRVHAAMLLQSGGRTNALRTLLADEQERGTDFLRLANALSALYPRGSEEKRLLDAMLLAVPR